MSERAILFSQTYGGVWSQHPEYPIEEWQQAVWDDETRVGYWDWVLSKIEAGE